MDESRAGETLAPREDVWACEGQSREMLAAVCFELNISKWELSALTVEYRGISARELVDGLRLEGVRSAIAARVRTAARSLWQAPGAYVFRLISDERLKVYGGGKSEYFVDPTEEFHQRGLAELREERLDALQKEFDAGWKRGGASRERFAVELGFRNFSELNRACLNVWGKSVRDVAWDVGGEILDFYMAREAEELRELAVAECSTPGLARARYLYHGSTAAVEGDAARVSWLWDAKDEKWLEGMAGFLG